MTPIYMQIIGALATAAAISILLFDKRGRSHNMCTAVIAWLMFSVFGCLAVAAAINLKDVVDWLLAAVLAIAVLNIILAKGSVNQINPLTNRPPPSNAKQDRPQNRHPLRKDQPHA